MVNKYLVVFQRSGLESDSGTPHPHTVAAAAAGYKRRWSTESADKPRVSSSKSPHQKVPKRAPAQQEAERESLPV